MVCVDMVCVDMDRRRPWLEPNAMTVKVGLMETVCLPALYRKVRPDECTWTIEGGSKVIATLAKVDEEVWHQLDAM